jgi:ubiquinone/menaquinone biosynthesis C-methylase UbiE
MVLEDFLSQLYRNRFDKKEVEQKGKVWEVLCESFLQKYVAPDARVLDIGIGHGDFINNIRCKEKYAVDMNKDSMTFLSPDIKFFQSGSDEFSFLKDGYIDLVFMSNFSEHLRSKDDFIKTLIEVRRILKPRAKLIILGPNIKYLYREYWDFFDHHIPLSDKGVTEILRALGFEIDESVDRFLPYTTKSRLPKCGLAVKMYLKFPFIWKVMGKQMFIVARKPTL